MGKIVLGIGTSHTPMLNAPVVNWTRFIERDRTRAHLDKAGNPVTYDQLVELAGPDMAKELEPATLERRHAAAMAQVDHVGKTLREAQLDALIVVGDDQKELFHDNNMPSMLLYRGESIRNVPLHDFEGPQWAADASARYYEPNKPRDYPVDAALAHHLIDALMDNEFDLAVANSLPEGYGEGHAFGFVHNRLLNGTLVPVVPLFHANSWSLAYSAPMTGASLVMPGAKLDGPSLLELLNGERVTLTAAVPTVWFGLLQHLEASGARLDSLKRVVIGGSACPRAMTEAFETRYGVEVSHAWGMTEMSPLGSFS